MSDSWDDRKKALEEEYFNRANAAALANLGRGDKARLSPITGKPMVTKTIMGVTADYCEESGGLWLDKGELETIIDNQKNNAGWFDGFIKTLRGG